MMHRLLLAVSTVFNYLAGHWQMALFIILAVLLLLAIMFKPLKRTFIITLLLAVVFGAVLLVDFIIRSVNWTSLEFIDFAISWGPTILFAAIVLFSTWVGTLRGLRKSLVLLLQATLAGVFWIIFYFVSIKSQNADKILLKAVNLFMGDGGLQAALGVGSEAETLRQVLVEFIPRAFGADSQIGMLIAENGAYLYTLADMAIHVVFATVYYIFYLVTVFLLYLVYHIFYSERKYKRKKTIAFRNNKTDSTYKKRRLGGGFVGLARGLAVALISLSFIGSAFYIVAGGRGESESRDYDFGKQSINDTYSIYRSIEHYGAQGIFKILNFMSDPQDSPYYLFAADLILSGELDDKESGISDSIVFSEELGAFTGFARDTFDLLMKYGEEDITPLVNGSATASAFDTVLTVMRNPEFQTEFDYLIDKFDEKTYIINLSMSLVNSVVAHVDDLSFTSSLSADTRELMKIMFKKGYLSERIPDELTYMQTTGVTLAKGKDVRPYLGVSDLVTKNDAKILLRTVLTFLSERQSGATTLGLVRKILPELQGLSALSGSKQDKINLAFGRVYCFIENRYLTAEGESGIEYATIRDKNIIWTEEIRSLIDVVESFFALYDDIYTPDTAVIDIILKVFSEDNANREKDMALYDDICGHITDSRLVGQALSTSYVYQALQKNLGALFENFYVPENLVYENTYDEEGNLISYGELYQFLYGLRSLGSGENQSLISAITGQSELTTSQMIDLLAQACSSPDEFGNMLSMYLSESGLLRSVMTSALIELGDDVLYIPQVSLERNSEGETVHLIIQGEFKQLLDSLDMLSEFVVACVDGNYLDSIDYFLRDDEFYSLVESNRIFEGTMAKLLSVRLQNNKYVVLPRNLIDGLDGWVTVNNVQGELRRFVHALRTLQCDLASLVSGDISNTKVINDILDMDEDDIDLMFTSTIMHYTVSEYLLNSNGLQMNGLQMIIPTSAQQALSGDGEPSSLIRKIELLLLFHEIAEIGVKDGMGISDVVVQLARHKQTIENSRILAASIVATIVANADTRDLLELSDEFVRAGDRSQLLQYNSSNPWQRELPALLDALDEILSLSEADDSFVLDESEMTDALSELLKTLNDTSDTDPNRTKLELSYDSEIIRGKLTKRLDSIFKDGNIVSDDVIAEAKSNGYYTYDEMRALSRALDAFNLDILNLKSDELVAEVKAKILSLNDPFAGEETMLDAVYPSVIISYLMSDELDKATASLLDDGVGDAVKGGSVRYPKSEIAAIVGALKELELDSVDAFETYDFKDIRSFLQESTTEAGKTRLSVIYRSKIAAGMITKPMRESIASNEILAEHTKAYEEGVPVYRESEVAAIIQIFGNADEAQNFNFDVSQVKNLICDGSGATQSYLLAASLSKELAENEGLYVPRTAVDRENCILPEELAAILDVYLYLSGDGSTIDNWEIQMKLPQGEVRESMFGSLVMRATISMEIQSLRKGAAVREARVLQMRDVKGRSIIVLSEEELGALSDALVLCGTGDAFDVPEFNLDTLKGYDGETLAKLFESDIVRYRICDCVLSDVGIRAYLTYQGYIDSERVYLLDFGRSDAKDAVSLENLNKAFEQIS